MFKSLLRASLLLAPAVTAIAATPSADLDELHQRQFRYARAMMQLNQIEGFERGPSIDALLRQEREAKAKRAEQGWRAAADARTQLMDAFAQAVERVATEQRAKRTMSRQWRIDEPYPSHWSVSGNETAAADCARAIEHPLGQPLRIEMIRGGVAWVRVVAPKKGHWAYDTVISEFDTKLSVYRDCRDTGGDPVRESDDALGLGSAVGLDAEAEGQTWMIKIEHKGGLGSVAIAKGVPAGTVSGRVTRASDGTPIPGVYVRSTSEGTGGVWSGYTNAQGNYQLEVMEDGEFYLRAGYDDYSSPRDYVPEVFPSAVCASTFSRSSEYCSGTKTLVAGTTTGQVTGIDFALDTATVLSGMVTDESSGAPLAGATVRVFAADELTEIHTDRSVATDKTGRFRIGGLPSRTWRIEYSEGGHATERWNDLACVGQQPPRGCELGSGDEVLTQIGVVTQVSAALRRMPHIDLLVRRGGMPMENVYASVFTPEGAPVMSTSSHHGTTVAAVSVGPLAPGSYRIVLHSEDTFSHVVGGSDCEQLCAEELASGQLIEVPVSAAPIEVNLRPRPKIQGRLTRQSDGSGVARASIALYTASGHYYSIESGPTGYYDFGELVSNDYYVHFSAPSLIDELHGDVICEQMYVIADCALPEPIHVGLASPDVQTVDASLGASGGISGTILGLQEYSGINSFSLDRVSETGAVQKRTYVDLVGNSYNFDDAPPGTHYWGVHASGYYKQLYPGLNCGTNPNPGYSNCSAGSPIAIHSVSGVTQQAIDFQLTYEGYRPLRVIDDRNGLPIAGVVVDQWTLGGVWLRSDTTNSAGWLNIRPDSGAGLQNYYAVRLSTDGLGQYIDEVYDDIQCPVGTSVYRGGCSLAGAWVVPVTDANRTLFPPLEIRLRSADPVFESGFE
jgi:hypothetical protein